MLEAVTMVLERRAGPMRVREIHPEVERAFDGAVPFSSVNEALSSHTAGDRSRFRRVRYGIYERRAWLVIANLSEPLKEILAAV